MNNKVYIRDCAEYDAEKIEKIVSELIDNILAEREESFDFAGKSVVLKPNLLSKKTPDAAVTTSPLFVIAAAKKFISMGANVTVADSPGGPYTSTLLNGIYTASGMKSACEKSGAQLNTDLGHTEVRNENGVASKNFYIINPLAKADFIVNLARLKTHSLCLMSASVKNMYGSVPGLTKAEIHARFPKIYDFSNYLVDLCQTVKPEISIVDAIVAMEGNGPAAGSIKKVGAVLASSNPYALDLVCSKIMKFDSSEIDTITHSVSRGLCPENVEDIQIDGEHFSKYASDFIRPDSRAGGLIKQLPVVFGGRLQRMLEPRPVVDKSKCIGCRECQKCCPAQTIKIENNKATIIRENCIKCYCCQELCPKKAIYIKRSIFLKV